jgi:hypothetical protein
MALCADGRAEDDQVLGDRAVQEPELAHGACRGVEDPLFILADVARVRPARTIEGEDRRDRKILLMSEKCESE